VSELGFEMKLVVRLLEKNNIPKAMPQIILVSTVKYIKNPSNDFIQLYW
jgi:hypothetical protein